MLESKQCHRLRRKIPITMIYVITIKTNIAKYLTTDDSFRSCYCGTVFKHYQDFLLGFCSIRNTLKCNGRCSTIFHIECTNISISLSLPINLQNSVESNP